MIDWFKCEDTDIELRIGCNASKIGFILSIYKTMKLPCMNNTKHFFP